MSSPSRKTILIVVGAPGFSYSNPNSAVARYLDTLANALEEKGYDVSSIPPRAAGSPAAHVEQVSPAASRLKKILKSTLPYLYNTLAGRSYFKKQEEIFGEAKEAAAKADLVIEFLTYGSEIGVRLKRMHNKPLVVIYDSPLKEQYREMHGGDSFFTGRISKAESSALREADMVICYSDAVKEHIVKETHRNNDTAVLPCIVWKDDGIASPDDNAPVIGFIGSFLKWHRVDLLVKAFEITGQEFPSARLVLVGWGQEWQRVKAMVDVHPLADRIIMTGFVNESTLAEWKRKFSIGVMPGSNWYGSPLKLFEYAQARIPFISPGTPVVRSLFAANSETFFIEGPDELSSLVRHLRTLLNNRETREKLAGNVYKKMNTEFAKEHQMAIFTGIIHKILQRGVEK